MKRQSRKSHVKSPKSSLQHINNSISKNKASSPPSLANSANDELAKIISSSPSFSNFPELPQEILQQLEKLPISKDKLTAVEKSISLQIRSHSSNYPDPQLLSGLEAVCPGSAERIMNMVEKTHAKKLEQADANIRKINTEGDILKTESLTSSRIVKAQILQSLLGMIIATLLIFTFLGLCAFFCLYWQKWSSRSVWCRRFC